MLQEVDALRTTQQQLTAGNNKGHGYTDQRGLDVTCGIRGCIKLMLKVNAGRNQTIDLITQIIKNAPWLRDKKYRLILQAQSSGQDLRRSLSEMGFGIEEETLVEDGGFLYQVMCVRFGLAQTLTPGQQYISPQLLMSDHELLLSYFERIENALKLTVDGLRKSDRPQEKLQYYVTALSEVREMRERYDRQKNL